MPDRISSQRRDTLSDIQIIEQTLGPKIIAGRTIEGTKASTGDITITRIEQKEKISDDKIKPTHKEKTEIGRGGMGMIFSVEQKTLEREVAVKELKPELASQEYHRNKFLEEAIITGQIEHPNIPPTHHLDTQRCRWSMKKIKGKTLEDILEGPHNVKKIVRLLLPVCDALSCAHSKGVVHRDIKPENIMIGEYGEVYVMDWGIARLKEAPEQPKALQKIRKRRKEENGMIAGTPKFMSPEQANGEIFKVDERTDIYALGCIIYQIMTGKLPIEATNVMALFAKKTNPETKIRMPRKTNKELAAICMQALEFYPEYRYQTATELKEDIQRWLDNEKISIYDYNTIERTRKWIQNNTGKTIGALGLAGALIAGSVGGIIYINLQAQKSRAAREEAIRKLAEKERDQAQIQRSLAEKEKNLAQTLAEKTEIAKELAEKERDRAKIRAALSEQEKNTAKALAEKTALAKKLVEKERDAATKEVKEQQQCEALLNSIKFLKQDKGYYEAARSIISDAIAVSNDYWKPYLVLAKHKLDFGYDEDADALFEKANELYRKQFGKDSVEILFETGMHYGFPFELGA